MVDSLTKEARSKNMQAIKSNNTNLELKLSKEIWNEGIRFRKNSKKLFGKPDISIKKYKIVIFIDSCFWHGCELHYRIPKSNEDFWYKKIHRNIERDKQVTDYYKIKGWYILRVWEHQIKDDFEGAKQMIISFIQSAKQNIYKQK